MSDDVLCSATKANGEPCRAYRVEGTELCKYHGGRRDAKRNLTDIRRELAEREKALDARERALVKRDPGVLAVKSVYRTAAEAMLGHEADVEDPVQVMRAMYVRSLAVLHTIEKSGEGHAGNRAYGEWQDRTNRFARDVQHLENDAKYVKITIAQATGLVSALDEALRNVGLDEDTQNLVKREVSRIVNTRAARIVEVAA